MKRILLVAGVLVIVFLAVIAFQPPDYTITRKITINAPAEKIYPYLNSTKRAELWMPWKDIDPDSKSDFSGPEEGVGAKTNWHGGKKMGVGSATITAVVPNQKVNIKLDYQEPFPMSQNAEYLIEPAGTANVVSWTVKGQNNFVGRLMCVFVNMDKMVGEMFEKGLANLKTLSEKP